jgi:hypothetical protein
MPIEPRYFTLDLLLHGSLFRIPDYQRVYSWGEKQQEDLFTDIRKLMETPRERHHFMATIVCLKTKVTEQLGADEFQVYHLVDGQQRLTTLTILLKAIAKRLSADANPDRRKEGDKLGGLLVKGDRRLILLQTNHESQIVFRHYLEDGTIPDQAAVSTMAELNLCSAFGEAETFVATQGDPLALLRCLKNRLGFVLYILEDEGAAYYTFEVLNSRGLEVDALDKCKSMLMGLAFDSFGREVAEEHITQLNEYWRRIYRAIGLRAVPGHEILRFAGTFRHKNIQSKVMKSQDAIEIFREKCKGTPKEVLTVCREFLAIAEALAELYGNPRLRAATRIGHARFLTVAIKLSRALTPEQREAALSVWDKVTFRIFGMCRKDARTKVGDYARLAQKVRSGAVASPVVGKEIGDLVSGYKLDDAVAGLRCANCYEGWEEGLRYFLYRYEEYLSRKGGAEVAHDAWEQIWAFITRDIHRAHPPAEPDAGVGGEDHGRRNRATEASASHREPRAAPARSELDGQGQVVSREEGGLQEPYPTADGPGTA